VAMPIRPTPKLDEKATIKFLKMVDADLDKPSGQKCDLTKVREARRIAETHAAERKKLRKG